MSFAFDYASKKYCFVCKQEIENIMMTIACQGCGRHYCSITCCEKDSGKWIKKGEYIGDSAEFIDDDKIFTHRCK